MEVSSPNKLGFDHKVVVVLDHGPKLLDLCAEPCSIKIRDVSSNKQKDTLTFNKTLWSIAVESCLDFHRVLIDIFSNDNKLLRYVIADNVGRFLSAESTVKAGWGEKLLAFDEGAEIFKKAGAPISDNATSVVDGLQSALSALTEKTMLYKNLMDEARKAQHTNLRPRKPITLRRLQESINHMKTKKIEASVPKNERFPNKGSLILFTSVTSATELSELEAFICKKMKQQNEDVISLESTSSEDFHEIDQLRVYVVNLTKADELSSLPSAAMHPLDEEGKIQLRLVSCASSSSAVRSAMHAVAIDIYGLASLTVCNIPMKEENKSSQAKSYDVELLLPRFAFSEIDRLRKSGDSELFSSNGEYETLKLSWSTAASKFYTTNNVARNIVARVSSSVPVSTTIFRSRETVCLTSYLASGRVVFLDTSKTHFTNIVSVSSFDSVVTHTLISRNSRIYAQALTLEKIQWSAKCKALTDADIEDDSLRVDDFKLLMREAGITFLGRNDAREKKPGYYITPLRHLLRITRYWPLHKNDALFSYCGARFEKLFLILRNVHLTPEEFNEAKRILCEFIGVQSRPDLLFVGRVPNLGISKTSQFDAVAQELSLYLANYVNHSKQHMELFEFFIEAAQVSRKLKIPVNDVNMNTVKRHCIQNLTEAQSLFAVSDRRSPSRESSPSSRSSSPAQKKRRDIQWPSGKIKLSTVLDKLNYERPQRTKEFEARKGDGAVRLYPELDLTAAPKHGATEM